MSSGRIAGIKDEGRFGLGIAGKDQAGEFATQGVVDHGAHDIDHTLYALFSTPVMVMTMVVVVVVMMIMVVVVIVIMRVDVRVDMRMVVRIATLDIRELLTFSKGYHKTVHIRVEGVPVTDIQPSPSNGQRSFIGIGGRAFVITGVVCSFVLKGSKSRHVLGARRLTPSNVEME